MSMDTDLETEYYNRLNERFTPAEIIDILDVTVEEIWSAFYDRLLENQTLLIMSGMQEEE